MRRPRHEFLHAARPAAAYSQLHGGCPQRDAHLHSRPGDVATSDRCDGDDEWDAVDSGVLAALAVWKSSTKWASTRIRAASKKLKARCCRELRARFNVGPRPRCRNGLAGTVRVNVPDACLVSRTLKARGLIVDTATGRGVRHLTALLYTTVDEVDRIMRRSRTM